jgi:hypothetical protein
MNLLPAKPSSTIARVEGSGVPSVVHRIRRRRWAAGRSHQRVCPNNPSLNHVRVCIFAAGSRKRTPTPPPFSAMNTIPAASNAERSFSTVEILASPPISNRFTVFAPMSAALARSTVLQLSALRAIRH